MKKKWWIFIFLLPSVVGVFLSIRVSTYHNWNEKKWWKNDEKKKASTTTRYSTRVDCYYDNVSRDFVVVIFLTASMRNCLIFSLTVHAILSTTTTKKVEKSMRIAAQQYRPEFSPSFPLLFSFCFSLTESLHISFASIIIHSNHIWLWFAPISRSFSSVYSIKHSKSKWCRILLTNYYYIILGWSNVCVCVVSVHHLTYWFFQWERSIRKKPCKRLQTP